MDTPFSKLGENAPIIREAMGFDDFPNLIDNLDIVELDLDLPSGDVMAAFEKSNAIEPVILKEGTGLVANLNMAALATLLIRNPMNENTTEAIMSWASRVDLIWCKRGAHFTMDDPCRTHGA
jgi:hypothetical protein